MNVIKLLWRFLQNLAALLTFVVVFWCCILFFLFEAIKVCGPLKSSIFTPYVQTAIEKNLPNTDVTIENIFLAGNNDKISIQLRNISLTSADRIVIVKELDLVFDAKSLLFKGPFSAIVGLSVNDDIEIHDVVQQSQSATPETVQKDASTKTFVRAMRDLIEQHLGDFDIIADKLKTITFQVIHGSRIPVSFVVQNIALKESVDDQVVLKTYLLMNKLDIVDVSLTLQFGVMDDVLLDCNVNNIPLSVLWHEHIEKIDSSIKIDFLFQANIVGNDIRKFDFYSDGFSGQINANDSVQKFISPKVMKVEGHLDRYDVWVMKFLMQADEISVSGSIDTKNGVTIIKANLSTMPVESLLSYWPTFFLPDAKKWLDVNLKNGYVNEVRSSFVLSRKFKGRNSFMVALDISNSDLYYEAASQQMHLQIKKGAVHVDTDKVTIKILNGAIMGSNTKDIQGVIDYKNPSLELKIKGNVHGSAQSLIDVAFAHSQSKNTKLVNFKGDATTAVDIKIPLTKEFVMDAHNTFLTTQIKNVSNDNLFDFCKLNNATLKAVLSGTMLKLHGEGIANGFVNVIFDMEENLAVDTHLLFHMKVNTSIKQMKQMKFFDGQWMDGNVNGNVVGMIKGTDYHFQIGLDLKELVIAHPIGIRKSKSEDGQLLVTLQQNSAADITKITSYHLEMPTLVVEGQGELDKHGLKSLSSERAKLYYSLFAFNYARGSQGTVLKIKSKKIDLRNIDVIGILQEYAGGKGEQSSIGEFRIITDIDNIVLNQGINLFKPKIDLRCSKTRCDNVVISGEFFDHTKFNIAYKYPNISVVSESASKFLSALGLYEKLSDGSFVFQGKYDKNGRMVGRIDAQNFYLRKTPFLMMLMSPITSLKGMIDMLQSKGIFFRTMTSGIIMDQDRIYIDSFSMDGPMIYVGYSAMIDQNSGVISGDGSLVPANIINTITKSVPILGSILLGGNGSKSGLVALKFVIQGSIKDIKIAINPLSAFGVGFLNHIFDREKSFKRNNHFPVVEY